MERCSPVIDQPDLTLRCYHWPLASPPASAGWLFQGGRPFVAGLFSLCDAGQQPGSCSIRDMDVTVSKPWQIMPAGEWPAVIGR